MQQTYRLVLSSRGFDLAKEVMDAFGIPFGIDDKQPNAILTHNKRHKEAVEWYLKRHYVYKGMCMDELVAAFRDSIVNDKFPSAVECAMEIAARKHSILSDDAPLIIGAIAKNDGYCPCSSTKVESKKCPCLPFRDKNKCSCELFVQG